VRLPDLHRRAIVLEAVQRLRPRAQKIPRAMETQPGFPRTGAAVNWSTPVCDRHRWLGAALLLIVLTGWAHLTGWPLLPVDETRYVSVAWEMWLRGDWLVPRLNGALYTDKPPLLFWLIHLGWAVGGVSDVWPRLIPTLAAAVNALMTARLARRLWPGEAPEAAAAWILITCGLWFLWMGLVLFDLLLTAFVLLGWNALVDPPWGRARWLWWTFAVAGGVLTKGPVILLFLVPPAVCVRFWHPGAKAGWHRHWTVATAAGLLLVLLWFVPAIFRAGWGYAQAIGLQQTAGRLVHSYAHRRWLGWYLPLAPVISLPWSLWALCKLRLHHVRAIRTDLGMRFLAAAMFPAFVVLCLVSGKQAHYLLPLFPAFALMLARAAQQLRATERGKWPWLWAGWLGLPLVGWAAPGWLPPLGAWQDWAGAIPWWAVGMPAALGLLLAWLEGSGLNNRPEFVGAVWGLGMWILCMGVGPALREHFQLEDLAKEVRRIQTLSQPVGWVGRYQGQLHFLGRLESPLAILGSPEVPGWAAAHSNGFLLVPFKHWPGPELCAEVRRFRVGQGGIVLVPAARTVLTPADLTQDRRDGAP
jgi:4-amino-4-deoxy-L-arabinose transferase-like glycosyltransferase